MALGKRFRIIHIQRGAGQVPLLQRFIKGFVVQQPPAGRIGDKGPLWQLCQLPFPDQPPRLRRQPRMQGEDLGMFQQGGQIHRLRPDLTESGRGDPRIISQYPHPEGPQQAGHPPPHIPQTHHSRRFPFQLLTALPVHVEGPVPNPFLHPRGAEADPSHPRQNQSHGKLGGGRGIASRTVENRNFAPGCRLHIHIDGPAPAHPDRLQSPGPIDHRLGDGGHIQNQQIGIGGQLRHLLRITGVLQHLVPVLKRRGWPGTFRQREGGLRKIPGQDRFQSVASHKTASHHGDFQVAPSKEINICS